MIYKTQKKIENLKELLKIGPEEIILNSKRIYSKSKFEFCLDYKRRTKTNLVLKDLDNLV